MRPSKNGGIAEASFRPTLTDMLGKQRAKAVPLEAGGFVANVYPAFMQDVLNLSQAERVADAAHHRQFDDIGTGFEVSEGEGARHGAGYGRRPATLKQSSSDRTLALDVEREIVESLLGQ